LLFLIRFPLRLYSFSCDSGCGLPVASRHFNARRINRMLPSHSRIIDKSSPGPSSPTLSDRAPMHLCPRTGTCPPTDVARSSLARSRQCQEPALPGCRPHGAAVARESRNRGQGNAGQFDRDSLSV
jgi:hypothetical protein